MLSVPDRSVIVAPMLGYTDRHCRKLLRIIAPHAYLFTEMIVAAALIHGQAKQLLPHSEDTPCVLQVGGSNPTELAASVQFAQDFGYQEINLNVGCPSDRVQQGQMGVCLMLKPAWVGQCIAAMQAVARIPVTVKCRIGVDHQDSFADFANFIEVVSGYGCRVFYIHARKAHLHGLSPKENREIPPLKYDFVYQAQEQFPHLTFYLNGGIHDVQTALDKLKDFPGVMIGRASYRNPYLLAELEQAYLGHKPLSHTAIIDQYVAYGRRQTDHPRHLLKHLLGLYTGHPGARQFRRYLSHAMLKDDTTMDSVYAAMQVAGLAA